MTPPILHYIEHDDPRSFRLDDQSTLDDLAAYIESIGGKVIAPKTGAFWLKCWVISQPGEKAFRQSRVTFYDDRRLTVLGPIVQELAALVESEVAT